MNVLVSALVGLLLWPGFESISISANRAEAANSTPGQSLLLGEQMYRINCAMCHGVDGDGNGPAAAMFRIQPRDFRRGIFKFRSTPSGSLPTDSDLLRVVSQGLRWTGMVSRSDLRESDRRAVIQYLKTFSSRFVRERPGKAVSVPPTPKETPQLLEQGKKLYEEVRCDACHGETGRGDGPSSTGLKDDWGWPIWPSDLTWRPLKRGSDQAGIYLSLVTGLSGTPMPSYASSLNSRQVWSLVYYLESLVPRDHRLSPNQALGEEQQGWMTIRMGRMMGRGMMQR